MILIVLLILVLAAGGCLLAIEKRSTAVLPLANR